MCMMVRLGKPALRTGRLLALIATGLPRRHTACRHHSMIDLRTPGGGSFAGPPRRRPGGWLSTASWAHLPGPRLGRPRRRRLGGLQRACQRDRNHHPDQEATRLPHLGPKEAFTHDSIHSSCPHLNGTAALSVNSAAVGKVCAIGSSSKLLPNL